MTHASQAVAQPLCIEHEWVLIKMTLRALKSDFTAAIAISLIAIATSEIAKKIWPGNTAPTITLSKSVKTV
jgi:hypothetical protein